MKGNAKCRKLGSLGGLGVTEGQRQCCHSIEHVRYPIVNNPGYKCLAILTEY